MDLAAHHFLLGGAGKDKGDDGVEQIDDEQGEQELFVPCEPLALLVLGGIEDGGGAVKQQGEGVVQRGEHDGGEGEGGEAEAEVGAGFLGGCVHGGAWVGDKGSLKRGFWLFRLPE